MSMARRIIPCLDTDGARVVKGVHFEGLRDAGDPVELAARYNAEGADELVVLDIAAARDNRPTFLETIRRVAEQLAIPLTAGGGIRSLEAARAVVRAGADKITVNTAAVERPELLSELSAEFGAQAVVLAIDAKREGGGWQVRIRGGRQATSAECGGMGAARSGDGSGGDFIDVGGSRRHAIWIRYGIDGGNQQDCVRAGDCFGRGEDAGAFSGGVHAGERRMPRWLHRYFTIRCNRSGR